MNTVRRRDVRDQSENRRKRFLSRPHMSSSRLREHMNARQIL